MLFLRKKAKKNYHLFLSEPKANLGLLELLIQHGQSPQLRGGNAAARSLNLLGKTTEGGEGGVGASRAAP